MAHQPAVRAGAAHNLLEFLETFRPGSLALVRSRIPPDTLAAIDSSSSWLPVEHHGLMVDAMAAVFGIAEVRRLYREYFSDLARGPLLRNLVLPALRLFGRKPRRILGVIPNGWKLGYRDFARLEITTAEKGHVVIAMKDFAPEVFDHPGYFDGWQGLFHGVLDLCHVSGDSVEIEIDRPARRATLTFLWTPD